MAHSKDLIEAVDRAMYDSFVATTASKATFPTFDKAGEDGLWAYSMAFSEAIAGLDAQAAYMERVGLVVVPREPTLEMLEAAIGHSGRASPFDADERACYLEDAKMDYQYMIAATQKEKG